ncbi:YopX family protein [Lactiplantibacillus argentoratensis]|uniref:YopX family protein n=1 Tax=Lactiplantibacillus argentoratensis TaxID=271881 RepID=UPI003D7D71B8
MIKFRAWDKKNEIYLYNIQDAHDTVWGFVKYDDGKIAEYDEPCFGDFLNNERYVVEQFTGLDDIYVGDILHFGSMWFIEDDCEPKEEEHTGFVEYISDYASYVVNCDDGVYTFKELTSFDGYSIQGNVHTNPGLLEE